MNELVRRIANNSLLIVTACFAFVWICHRASVQSITIDEADTFRHWVNSYEARHWEPHSNNHVLNSTLMRLSVWLFGQSELAVRLPALLGGALYILAILRLCALLTAGHVLRCALFVCFVYNPLIMDYLVAARGYALALGFFAITLFLLARGILGGIWTLRDLALLSACVGLSICSNFSFAYASGFLLLAAATLTALPLKRTPQSGLRIASACSLPALTALLVLAGSALTRFSRRELSFGADSLSAMWKEIAEASFMERNPYLINPLLDDWFEAFGVYFPWILACFALLSLITFATSYRRPEARAHWALPAILAAALSLTVLTHWLQFKLLKIPLPLERTSIFLLPLVTALIGSIVAIVPFTHLARVVQAFGMALVFVTGFYFIGELRDGYFRQWRAGSELKTAFPFVVDLCRRNGYREIIVDWNFPNSMNFYRSLHHVTDIEEVQYYEQLPTGKPVYLLSEAAASEFLRNTSLKQVWHGTYSDLVILVQPD